MELCSGSKYSTPNTKHEEVCFENSCPVCDMLEAKNDEISKLNEKIAHLLYDNIILVS